MDEVVLSSCFLLFKNSIPTSTHIKPHISTAVEMCGNLWVAFSQDYTHSHPQISTTVEICGNLWVASSQDYTHSHPQISTTVEICGNLWVAFSQDYTHSHPQISTTVEICGNLWFDVGNMICKFWFEHFVSCPAHVGSYDAFCVHVIWGFKSGPCWAC